MYSLKTSIRRTITGMIAAAMATTIFVGCSNANTSSDLSSQPLNTSAVTDNLTPGINESEVSTPEDNKSDTVGDFSIKYMYWYDNPEVAKSQELTATATDAVVNGSDNLFMGLADLPVHTDADGNEYIMSGRTRVFLSNRKIGTKVAQFLRTEVGDRVYSLEDLVDIKTKLDEFHAYLMVNGKEQPLTLAEREAQDAAETEPKEIESTVDLYVNNLKTEFTTNDGLISVADILACAKELGSIDCSGYDKSKAIVVSLNTAAGKVEVMFRFSDTTVDVSYSTNIEGTTLAVDDSIIADNTTIRLAPDILERTLGYDVEIYDDFVNVVTDNKDLFNENAIVSNDTMAEHIDPALNGVDATKPMTDPDNKAVLDEHQAQVDEATKIAEEREENIPVATTEEANEIKNDREVWQEMADDTSAYTTDGVPQTSKGDLAAPVKPTANYKLPKNAQLEFTGDAGTAMTTTLPEGCYWAPTPTYPNAFVDPAGNRWCNNKRPSDPARDSNCNNGYYDPQGHYHHSQDEIDSAAALNAEIHERWENGPSGSFELTEEEKQDLIAALGW